MEINNLEKFRDTMAGRTAIGTVITLSDPAVSELAADAGFDFTWIDAEHAPHTLESIMGHVMAVRGTNCAPLVRVPWNEPGIIKPILDLAPAGVIIPMVNTVTSLATCAIFPAGRWRLWRKGMRVFWQVPAPGNPGMRRAQRRALRRNAL
jgi:2-keto-3-deoxy-L-rhamnonate aldolase RhmA